MIKWFARNGVAANLLMFVILAGGLASLSTIKLEMFPKFDLDVIVIRVPYPGSTPEETEEGICIRIEEEIYDLQGIKKITSSAVEGFGVVTVEIERGFDASDLLDRIKVRVDSITTFPENAEEPIVDLPLIKSEVINLAIYGDADARVLKEYAEKVRDDLVDIQGITQVEVFGLKDYEISIEVSESALRKYGISFSDVTSALRQSSLDLPGGTIRSQGGEILLRSIGQAYVREDFENIVIVARDDGSRLLLSDVATVVDGFTNNTLEFSYDGKNAASLRVFEVGDQNTIDVAEKVTAYAEQMQSRTPEGLEIAVWGDWSFYLKGRIDMLRDNGLLGLVLVFALLALFLRPSLAIWVTLGIPISFLGAFLLMPYLGVSVNIVSLFGLIMVLGIVVDDAIVVGESVFSCFQKDGPGVESSIKGSHAVAIPVTFAVLTTAVAFIPILMLPGTHGKMMSPITLVVVTTLLFSLIESKLILPYHLSLCNVGAGKRESLNAFMRFQRKIADGLELFIKDVYQPFLNRVLEHKYSVTAIFVGLFCIMISLVMTNRVDVQMPYPQPPSDYIRATLTMTEGTPEDQTKKAVARMQEAFEKVIADLKDKGIHDPIEHWLLVIGAQPFAREPGSQPNSDSGNSNKAQYMIEMKKSENRIISAPEFADLWRDEIGYLPGTKELSFRSRAAQGPGMPVDIQIVGRNFDLMQEAAEDLKLKVSTYDGVYDVKDTFSGGKRELQIKVKPSAQVLGITQLDLAQQVRQAFYGDEVQRIQRGRDDIRVMVRYPEDKRRSMGYLEDMRVRLPDGREVPFHEVAETEISRSPSAITRVDRKRVINVQADADKEIAQLGVIINELSRGSEPDLSHKIKMSLSELPLIGGFFKRPPDYEPGFIQALSDKYPGIKCTFEGEARESRESNQSLFSGMILVMCLIYCLMAIPFKSYLQPMIIMSVIPFGLIGAIGGHILLGQSISMMSMMGMLAMAGVLVNDSLVLVDCINKKVKEGLPISDAIRVAGMIRFRPILLTSLTTFAGLTPILFERSLQAQFLIPMATSLAFGVVFGTFITLTLVPSCYLMLEDLKGLFRRSGNSS